MYNANTVVELANKASKFFYEAREASTLGDMESSSYYSSQGEKLWEELVSIVGEETANEIVY